tara:strand:+ start:2183 stop:2824 length:642 start_codon:yes stop_codon:yes gene_type:complete
MSKKNILKLYKNNTKIEVGIDEAGRGSLIGRVYAATVIWNPELSEYENNLEKKINEIKDSKKLSKIKRKELRDFIEEYAIDYGIGYVENDEIDSVNILNATLIAMHKSLDELTVIPDTILVDGNYFKEYYINEKKIDYECTIKGDDTYISIAAASILAKVYHDEYIEQLCKNDEDLLKYDLLNNMGYGTKKHLRAIKDYGISEYHRKSFKCCK